MADGDLCTQRHGAISEPERKEKEEVARQLQDYVTKLVVELIATLRGGIDDSKLDSGGARGLFKRRAMCGSSQEEGRGGIGLHRRVRVGYEQEEEEDNGGPRHKPERGEKGEAACGFGMMGQPNARADERSWARSLRAEGEIRKERAGPRREERRPSGQKIEKKETSIFFSFSNISKQFSNNV
jgi:hypothetical protein